MDKLPFDLTNISADDVEALEAIYTALRKKFKVSITDDPTFDLNNFEIFNNYKDVSIGGTLLINHPEKGCYLNFVKVLIHLQNGRGPSIDHYKYQVWASATLRGDFGRMVIRQETMIDRVLNVINPTELHFNDHTVFNKKFNVGAEDKIKAVPAMTRAFRNALMEIKTDDFVIEIVDSNLVIGNTLPLDAKQVVYFAEVAAKLSTVK
jgi:hypothetical protein